MYALCARAPSERILAVVSTFYLSIRNSTVFELTALQTCIELKHLTQHILHCLHYNNISSVVFRSFGNLK